MRLSKAHYFPGLINFGKGESPSVNRKKHDGMCVFVYKLQEITMYVLYLPVPPLHPHFTFKTGLFLEVKFIPMYW